MASRPPARGKSARKIAELEARLADAEETLRAIRSGEVDALVVAGADGERVYTLAGAEQPYRVLVEAMNEGAATLDASGVILYCNARFAQMLGRDLERVIGSSLRDRVLAADAGKFDALIARAGGQGAKEEVFLDGGTRGAIPVHLSLGVVSSSPRVLGIVATDLAELSSLREALRAREASLSTASRELAERIRVEEALRRSEAELREADRRKDDFLGILSHELRNPLAPVRNALHILDRSEPGSDTAARARDIIGRQIDHLTRLIDDLLDVTRIARGKVRLQRARFDLVDVVTRAVEDHRPLFTTRDIELRLDAAAGPLPTEGDAVRIAQVVGNLLHNAAKFTPGGGRVTVAVAREADLGVLRVEDTGVGIAPHVRERLFEPFFQAEEGLSRSTGGLGLGLALAKGIVELHAGTVEARSSGAGRGAEFVVRLPLVSELPQRAAPAERPLQSRRRVLVVEDNLDAAETLRMMLEMEGHDVDVAYDGREGVARARAFLPEVVLCDIGLPEMDGFAVARTLRADGALRSTYLVALTGYALPDDQRRAAEAGFDLHLPKPPTIEQIQDAVARSATRDASASVG
jgi:two-component system CheB/CheR fusion protein